MRNIENIEKIYILALQREKRDVVVVLVVIHARWIRPSVFYETL